MFFDVIDRCVFYRKKVMIMVVIGMVIRVMVWCFFKKVMMFIIGVDCWRLMSIF